VCVPCGVMGIEITENKSVRGVRETFRGEGARSRFELSVSGGMGVDIEEGKVGSLLEVNFDTAIV